MSSRGYNETLTTPSNHKDSSGMSLKAFDTHFKTLNNGLLSVAKNLSGMHTKVGELEVATKSTINLKHRVDTIEKTLAAHGKVLVDIRSMLGEMSKSQQTPPNEVPQSTTPAVPQKSRVQLMLEAQRLQVESKAKSAAAKPANDVQLTTPASTSAVEKTNNAKEDPKEDINAAVEDLLKATVSSSGVIEPIPKLDQILESANSVKTHDTYPDSDDETLAAVLKAKSGDPESDEDEPTSNASAVNASAVNASAVKVSGANTPKVQTQPKANPQKEDSESESEDDDNSSSESEDDDEDIEISDVEEESKPMPKPAPVPVKSAIRTQTGPSKPAPKPIPRRMVPQKKK